MRGGMSSSSNEPEYELFDGKTAEYDASFLEQLELERNMASVQILRGADTGMRVPLTKDSVTIGRTIEADLCLHDTKISRVHARIDRVDAGDEFTITDCRSTNGTFVNNRPVTEEVLLQDGDKLFLGHTILKFSLEDEVDSQSGEMVDRFLFKDDLTGLVVKRRFYNELRTTMQLAASRGTPLALLMMDMDGLKRVNDSLGHSWGAFVIGEAGRRIGEVCNTVGQACRFGGDEFVAFLRDHDKPAALEVGERVCSVIRDKLFVMEGRELDLSISIGVASFPDDGSSVDTLNRFADEALYRAKDKGRNGVSD